LRTRQSAAKNPAWQPGDRLTITSTEFFSSCVHGRREAVLKVSELVTLSSRLEPEDTAVVAAVGEIDLSNAPQLADALAAVNGVPRVVVDLTRCTFFDSSCLSVLARYAMTFREQGRQFSVRVDAVGRRVIELTNLGELLGLDAA
jgi:anti-anti-sigma factor